MTGGDGLTLTSSSITVYSLHLQSDCALGRRLKLLCACGRPKGCNRTHRPNVGRETRSLYRLMDGNVLWPSSILHYLWLIHS